jgi:hypothetical protein
MWQYWHRSDQTFPQHRIIEKCSFNSESFVGVRLCGKATVWPCSINRIVIFCRFLLRRRMQESAVLGHLAQQWINPLSWLDAHEAKKRVAYRPNNAQRRENYFYMLSDSVAWRCITIQAGALAVGSHKNTPTEVPKTIYQQSSKHTSYNIWHRKRFL